MGITQARYWRRIYLIFCLSLGVLTPLFCWWMIPDFNPIQKPLSYFGVVEHTSWIWNATLLVLSVGIFLNAKASFFYYFKKRSTRRFLRSLLWISSFSLVLTAVVNMQYSLVHKLAAACFFASYNFFVFCFGVMRAFKQFRKGVFSVVVGLLMLLTCLLLIPFPSYGVFEIVYMILIIYWNGTILKERMQRENRLFSSAQAHSHSQDYRTSQEV